MAFLSKHALKSPLLSPNKLEGRMVMNDSGYIRTFTLSSLPFICICFQDKVREKFK